MSFKVQKTVYWKKDFWHDRVPGDDVIDDIDYSTNWYSRRAVDIINAYTGAQPLWLHLAYQGVHAPYVDTPSWEQIPNDAQFCTPSAQVSAEQCQIFTNMLHV